MLLFPFAVDEMFVRLKSYLQASGGLAGVFAYPDLRANWRTPRFAHCRGPARGSRGFDPSWPLCPGFSESADGSTTSAIPAPTSVSARAPSRSLQQLELASREILQEKLRKKIAPEPERWDPVEPMASNPSRHFPELPHPRLTSGVALTTGAPDPHWEDPAPRLPPQVFTKASPAVIYSPPTQVVTAPPSQAIAAPPPRAAAAEERRLKFTAKRERAPASLEEKLIEVCGHFVPTSRAAAAAADCAPKTPAPVDEGGGSEIFMP